MRCTDKGPLALNLCIPSQRTNDECTSLKHTLAQVEPAIIGGLIIDVGEKHIDMSILTRIKKIEQILTESA